MADKKTAPAPSDASHKGKSKLTFWLDNVELAKLDAALADGGYTSRAEWLREKVREVTRA